MHFEIRVCYRHFAKYIVSSAASACPGLIASSARANRQALHENALRRDVKGIIVVLGSNIQPFRN